mmetsp:Transcript_17022/g.22920  ORF Transcript_17022/g.22920 Transcript_17022/m.22920 type:complete len:212 (+) Transcript_17022:29-664(+)|eukprot:Macronucleus_3533.p1 GENE.Macronucleus_3533~~Macronucleus_3533.p1  ORF type:complete len:212 (+),score=85.67 Macronucleus_3533:1-636(+)
MPKLVYFGLQGRAQAIRYLLGAKGVQFEDQHLQFAEWGPIKAANTYGEGVQLPVFINDDGKVFVQSMAILKMLAFEHGYMPETAEQEYEVEWLSSTAVDIIEKPERFVIMKDEPTAEDLEKCITLLRNFITKVDKQWSDGRAHAAGDKITHADFSTLAFITSHYENASGKHEAIRNATREMVEQCTNIARVMAPMRELCAAQIASVPAGSI